MSGRRDQQPPDDQRDGRRRPPHTPDPTFDRQPPHDLQAEQAALGGMLLSPQAITDVTEALAGPDDFYRPAHQTIYQAILGLAGRGQPVDPLTVAAELGRQGVAQRVGGAPYLHTLLEATPTAANAGYYAQTVAERAVLRRLVQSGARIAQLGYQAAAGQGLPLDEVIAHARAELDQATTLARLNGTPALLPGQRAIRLTPASEIKPRRVRWLWKGRLALGTLALLAGRESLGKSTITAWLIAQLTRGMLPGELDDAPRPAIIAATEDSWEFTIVPRLIAAGADLDLVYRCDVQTTGDTYTSLTLPADNHELEGLVQKTDAALIILDPLMSRIDAQLDTHRDAEVRQALEPVLAVADRTGAVLLGLIHLSKRSDSDPLTAVMGSRAFTAVARSVLMVARSPDEDGLSLFGQPKNNLGRSDLPILKYRVVSMTIGDDDGPIETGRVEWCGETRTTIEEALRAGGDPEGRSAVKEAADWLTDFLHVEGDRAERAEVIRKGAAAGHSKASLDRARVKLGLVVENIGFPRRTLWVTAEAAQAVVAAGETTAEEERRYV